MERGAWGVMLSFRSTPHASRLTRHDLRGVFGSDGPVPERLGRPVNDSAPQISVVIASVNGLPYPLACLESLASQDGDISAEVVLADCTGPATVAAVRERFPDVRLLAFDDRMSVPFLRAAGIREARGRLVAVTEDHCVPREDWYRQMVAAHHDRAWAAVGGGVENGSTERIVDWAVFFCEYSQHMSPVPEGPSDFIPGMKWSNR